MIYRLLFMFGALTLFSCTKHNTEVAPLVYVGGGDQDTAKYWINGTAVLLTDGSRKAQVNSMFVSGSDVYAAGYEFTRTGTGNVIPVAKYWKNKVPVVLSSDTTVNGSIAFSIFVSGNDVYVVGGDGVYGYGARYWKNGQLVALPQAQKTTSVFVEGSDVYISGQQSTTGAGVYWKNGNLIPLQSSNSSGAIANSIYVSNGDVYVAGALGQVAACWKNGNVLYSFPKELYSFASSVFVSDGNVYMCGGQDTVAKYWKNGIDQNIYLIPNFESDTNGIFVYGSDVYIAGHIGSNGGAYWKNGRFNPLSDFPQVTSIFVQHP